MFELQTTSAWIAWTLVHFFWMGIAVWLFVQACLFVTKIVGPERNSFSTPKYRVNLIGLLGLIACFPLAAGLAHSNLESVTASSPSKPANLAVVNSDSEVAGDHFDGSAGNPVLAEASELSGKKETNDKAIVANFNSTHPNTNSLDVDTASAFSFGKIQTLINSAAPIISAIYLLGVLMMLFRLTLMFGGCQRIKRNSGFVIDQSISDRVTRFAQRLKIRSIPIVRMSSQVATPVVVGILRPMLLLPTGFASGMTVREIDAILIHELAHICRWDHLVLLVQRVTEAVFFFHPATWSFSQQLSQTREYCCDDIVLQQGTDPIDYANGLCNVAQMANQNATEQPLPNLATAATGESSTELLGRVRRVLGDLEPVPQLPFKTIVVSLTALILVPLICIPMLFGAGFFGFDPVAQPAKLISTGDLTSLEGDSDSLSESYTVLGQVIDSHGKPVANARIESKGVTTASAAPIFADKDGKFKLETPCKYHIHVTAFSPDGGEARVVQLVENNPEFNGYSEPDSLWVGDTEKNPITITLAPTTRHQFVVTMNNEPVANAWVVGQTDGKYPWTPTPVLTDEQGRAELILPESRKLVRAVAAQESLGVGKAEPTEKNIELIAKTRTCSAQVLDLYYKPVAGVSVCPSGLTPFTKKTDENGRVEFDWFPPRNKFIFTTNVVDSRYQWNQMRVVRTGKGGQTSDHQTLDVFKSPEYVPLRGKITGEGDLGNVRIHFTATGFPIGDGFDVFTNAQGEFEHLVIPGLTYLAGVTDSRLASDPIKIEIKEDNSKGPTIAIPTYAATPIRIKIKDKNGRPVRSGGVTYHQLKPIRIKNYKHEILNGSRFEIRKTTANSQLRISQFQRPSHQGIVTLGSADGNIELIATVGDWRKTKKVKIKRGQAIDWELVCPAAGLHSVSGEISLQEPAGSTSPPFGACDVTLFDTYRPKKITTVESNADGHWTAKLESQDLAVVVTSKDKKLGGLKFVNEIESEFPTVKLVPTVSISGRLLDWEGKPIAGQELVQYHESQHINDRPLGYVSAITDEDGNFEFEHVITGIPQRLAIKNRGYHFLGGQKVYRKGDDASGLEVVYVDRTNVRTQPTEEPKENAKAEPVDIAKSVRRLASTVKHPKMHGLVILRQHDETEQERECIDGILESVLDYSIDHSITSLDDPNQSIPTINNYLPITLKVADDLDDDSIAELQRLGIKPPTNRQFILLIVDENGERISSKGMTPGEVTIQKNSGASKISEYLVRFLTRHAPETRDAQILYDEAIASAKRQGKKVFVKIGGPRCGPCLQMGRWVEQYRSVLEKDYVILGFHPSRCKNGVAVAKELVETYGGVPWCCVVDSEGKQLVTSDGPLGNIGFPTGGGDGTRHIINMLRQTGSKISDAELMALERSLTDWTD